MITPDDIGTLMYLMLLLAALAFWVFSGRDGAGRKLQYLGVWGLIIVGTVAIIGLWSDIRTRVAPAQASFTDTGAVTIPLSADGHFHVTLDINGEPVRFVVDTGASGVVLTRRDAARVGLRERDLAFFGEAMTANGMVRTAPVLLDRVALGPFQDSNLPASVNAGEMRQSLLGMSYLQRFDRLEISNNRLVLER
ncbi:MAG: retropepsin-like aspartic protease family protein [Primorskyibacter sp.]